MDVDRPAIAIVPYGMRPDKHFADRSLSDLDWPMGVPDRLSQGTIRDLGAQDHLVFYPSSTLWLSGLKHIAAQRSLMIVEPAAIHRRHMLLARMFHRKFSFVLSCNPDLLASIPNGLFFAFGTSWVPEWRELDLRKSADISLIASNKMDLEGHKLRHKVAQWAHAHAANVKLLGRAFVPFEQKSDGLAGFRYSVVIENTREPSYFTEKLIDAMLCRAVPIYWGAPDIGDYFDTAGMIVCETIEEIKEAIGRSSEADYDAREAPLLRNQIRAAEYIDLHQRAASTIAANLPGHD